MDETRSKRHHDLLEWVQTLAAKNIARLPRESGNDWWQRVVREAGNEPFLPWENTDDCTWHELMRVWDCVLILEEVRFQRWSDWVDEHYPHKETNDESTSGLVRT